MCIGVNMNINAISNVAYLANVNEQKTTEKSEKYSKQNRNQIKELSNICYKPLSFGRTWAEHKSWGASINPKTKEASFKIFTYPDTERVTVTVESKDEKGNEESKEYELKNKGEGIFASGKLSPKKVKHGDKYYYTIYRPNSEPVQVKDPYSFKQEEFMGKSVVYDHSLYDWHDEDWKNNTNRISRLANNKNGLTPVNAAKIYEFNTATFTKDGTFESAKEKMEEIKNLGFNAIEIMPVENTFSFNWGYDGVDKMAPAEHLGGPDQLKELVDYAHQTGLNVIMDMVPNHLGPDGAQLPVTGPYISHGNDFGDAFNFEGQNSRYVRDYMVNSALNWIDNYHCDGIRFDMTKYMNSDYTMKQIAAEINYHNPDAFLIAEDARNDRRVTTPLNGEEYGEKKKQSIHAQAIDKISNNEVSLNNLGMDSEWDFNYFHSLKDLMYGNVDFNTFEAVCLNSPGKVKYTMSHDEIGNYDGTRLISKLMVSELNMGDNVALNDEDRDRAGKLAQHKSKSYEESLWTVQCQKAQLTSEKLATMLQTGELDKYKNADQQTFSEKVLQPIGIKANSDLSYEKIKNAYETAYNKNKMGQALTYAIPGPKMVFQGDEKADLTPFRFFREFDSIRDEKYLYWEKGYQYGKSALEESKLDNIAYSEDGKKKCKDFEELTKDLNKLSSENSAMTNGVIINDDTVKHHNSRVLAIHTKDYNNGNELFTVANTQGWHYPDDIGGDKYYINFPEGKWVEILNTNDEKYGGNGKFMNNEPLVRNENNECPISMDNHSTVIFKRVD